MTSVEKPGQPRVETLHRTRSSAKARGGDQTTVPDAIMAKARSFDDAPRLLSSHSCRVHGPGTIMPVKM
jgi:hypothetical protein